MGVFDLPAPGIAWADETFSNLFSSDGVRIALWGVIAAILSMGIYWLISPQRRIARIVDEERRLRQELWKDNELTDGMGAVRRLLGLALARIGLVLGPVLVAALPVLCLMAWLQTHYAYALPPPGQSAAVQVEPAAEGRWIEDGTVPRVEVLDAAGALLESLTLSEPVPVIHKRVWWNVLIGNPLGYLPEEGPLERIEIDLPSREYLSLGPSWLRGWEALFITTLLLASIAFKVVFRIK